MQLNACPTSNLRYSTTSWYNNNDTTLCRHFPTLVLSIIRRVRNLIQGLSIITEVRLLYSSVQFDWKLTNLQSRARRDARAEGALVSLNSCRTILTAEAIIIMEGLAVFNYSITRPRSPKR